MNSGFDRKDDGMAQALANERSKWLREAQMTIIKNFRPGWVGLAEEFQEPVRTKLGPPHVPQVWSAMVNGLIKQGWFEHTGRRMPCRRTTNNACEGKELRRLFANRMGVST